MAWTTDNRQIIPLLESMTGKTITKVVVNTGPYEWLADNVELYFNDGTSLQIGAYGHSDDTHLQAEHLLEYPDPEQE